MVYFLLIIGILWLVTGFSQIKKDLILLFRGETAETKEGKAITVIKEVK